MIRIATWNINSVRARLDLAKRLVAEHAPDILCLQETKVADDVFPTHFFRNIGYIHQRIHGMKSYNGVAILSRFPFSKAGFKNWQGREDRRHIFMTLENGTELHCCYIPAGGEVPDPTINEKFAHKLGFLDEMTAWWKKRKQDGISKIFLGDFNIAPLENDVWSHRRLLDVVSHTPIEVGKLLKLQKAHDFVDSARYFIPSDKKLYSWWSYRSSNWSAADKGRRLDHIWVTPDLVSSMKSVQTLRAARGWEPRPSDHVPVILTLA